MPLALGLGTQRETFHWLDPEWQPRSVSHLPYLKPINCWTGFSVINILLTQAALAESFSSLIQTSILLKYLGNYPILSLTPRSWGIRDRNQILVMAMREEALWEKEEGSSGCVHFVMVIVHTKLLVLQEKTLPINHPLGSILLPSACIFIQGSYSCSFMEWRKPHLTLGTSSQKTRKPTQKAVGQTRWQLICIIFIVFSLWLFLILP